MPKKFNITTGEFEDTDALPVNKRGKFIEILQPNTILNGKSRPSKTLGEDGDFYIETESWEIYFKKDGEWGEGVSLRPADGKDGEHGRDGEDGDDGRDGKDGINGKDGVGVLDIARRGNSLVVELSNGEHKTFDLPVPDNGKDGRGIASIEQSKDGSIHVNYTDGGRTKLALPQAVNGREIELGSSPTHFQWRYKGEGDWRDLALIPKAKGRMGGGGGTHKGHNILDEGVTLDQRTRLDFVGSGVTVTDDAANDKTIVTISGGGTPGGSDTQVQFNDGGSFGGDAGLTYEKATDALTVNGLVHTPIVQAHTSAGLTLEAQGGGDVLLIGAGGGVNATAYGGWNFDGATANTIASFGASKTLTSLSTSTYPSLTELSYVKGVTSSIQTQIAGLVPYTGATGSVTLGANSLTATGITNSSMTSGSVLFAGASGVMSQDNANFSWDDTNKRLRIGPAGGATTSSFDDLRLRLITTTAGNNVGFVIGGNRNSGNAAVGGFSFLNEQSTTSSKQIAQIMALTSSTYDAESGALAFNVANNSGTLLNYLYMNNGNASPSVVINEDGNDIDFRVEGDTDSSLFTTDGGLDAAAFGGSAISGNKVTLYTVASANKGLVVRGAASQTGNLLEAQSSAGTAYMSVGPDTLPAGTGQSFIRVAGTLTASGGNYGTQYIITSAGAGSDSQYGCMLQLNAGYTGSGSTVGLQFENNANGTQSNYVSDNSNISYRPGGNYGLVGFSKGTTTGIRTGIFCAAGSGNTNYGLWSAATVTKNSATNIGVIGFGLNGGTSSTQIGGYFSLYNAGSAPSFTSAALLADNGAETSPIFIARDNGTAKVTIKDGGNVNIDNLTASQLVASDGSKDLVSVAASTFATSGTHLTLTAQTSSDKPLVVKGAASQTANLFEAQNSSGTAYFYVGPDALAGDSATKNFLNLTATTPTTLSATTNAINFDITTAGSSAQQLNGMVLNLNAGWTGAQAGTAIRAANNTAGTGTNYGNSSATQNWRTSNSNVGIRGSATASTTGINNGGQYDAKGSSTANYGSWCSATSSQNTPALNVGIIGSALNATTNCAGAFMLLGSGTPSFSSCALLADNGASTDPIFRARDNGTDVFSILDAGVRNHQAAKIDKVRVVTAAGAVTVSATTDHIVIVNKSSGAATTVNLPGSPTTGLIFIIKDGKGDAATNNITITPAAGNIDGAATFVMNTNYQSATVVYNGTEWNIV